MVEMEVKGIAIDSRTMLPVMVLKDAEEKRILPIWIGGFEAQAIIMQLEGVKPPRPMTHDLLTNILGTIKAKVSKVLVTELRDNTFYAVITLQTETDTYEIDARPSDAVAIALRNDAPIYVAESVIMKATVADQAKAEEEQQRFRDFFANLKPEDFEKFDKEQRGDS
ncbi:MAG: bifunctional nuclease family protein [bacterium]